jgi:hypothetical protein
MQNQIPRLQKTDNDTVIGLGSLQATNETLETLEPKSRRGELEWVSASSAFLNNGSLSNGSPDL